MVGGERAKRRIALILQYDGTLFSGWQLQENVRTVQGETEKALSILLKEKIRTHASGRTDAGVHAAGQVIHFDTNSSIPLDTLCISLNGIMKRDLSVYNAYDVDGFFHARYSAVSREYKYYIYNHIYKSPFMIYRAMWVHRPLSVEYLNEAAGNLIGEMDFSSFCKKKSQEKGTVRKIEYIGIKKHGDFIEFTIRGNAFLHNMIRIIVGTLVELNITLKPPADIIKIISAKSRDSGGKTAPPYGLYLNRVVFDPELHTFRSAYTGRDDKAAGKTFLI